LRVTFGLGVASISAERVVFVPVRARVLLFAWDLDFVWGFDFERVLAFFFDFIRTVC